MKRILLTTSAVLSIMGSVSPAFAVNASVFEPVLQIVPRYHAGTLEKDVDRSQGRKGLNVQLVGASPEQTAMLNAFHNQKVARNMTELRKYVVCVEKPELCKMASPK